MRTVGGESLEHHILVDISNVIHRAYYSLSRDFDNLNGEFSYYVTVRSLELLNSFLRDIPKKDKICVFFDGSSTKRKDIFPEYKGNRNKNHPLSSVWNRIVSDGSFVKTERDLLVLLLECLGCHVYFHPEEEADDLIASYVNSFPSPAKIIISNDKDFFQLLEDPKVVVYRTEGNGHVFYDRDKSTEYWTKLQKGTHPPVAPSQLRLFKSLCGDSSDNIKGVPRLFKKTAVSLCNHKDIEDLFSPSLDISTGDKEKIHAHRDLIMKNYELIGFHKDVDISKCLSVHTKNIDKARKILENDLNTHMNLSSFCSIDTIKSMNVLPDWYNDL